MTIGKTQVIAAWVSFHSFWLMKARSLAYRTEKKTEAGFWVIAGF